MGNATALFYLVFLAWILLLHLPLWLRLSPCEASVSRGNLTAEAIETLQSYLRIDTAQPQPQYRKAVRFIKQACKRAGLEGFHQFSFQRGRLGAVCSVQGREPHLGAVVLNSHIDVVPAESSAWRLAPPFSAAIVDGTVVARGSQDMKTQGVQYLEALRRLRAQAGDKWPMRRTVHVLFVPDEEVGGRTGMASLVNSSLWRDTLRPAVLIDECLPETRLGVYKVCYGERQPWWMTIRTSHHTAHGGTLPADTAIQRLFALLDNVLAYREQQRLAVESQRKALGEVLGVNVVHWASSGNGNATNVIPSDAEIRLDMRVPPHMSEPEVLALLEEWTRGSCNWHSHNGELLCANATYRIQFIDRVIAPYREVVDEAESMLYRAIAIAGRARNISLEPFVFPMSTDSRYVRQAGVPAYGIMALDGVLQGAQLHQPDESVPLTAFERGISFYMELVRQLAEEAHWEATADVANVTARRHTSDEL